MDLRHQAPSASSRVVAGVVSHLRSLPALSRLPMPRRFRVLSPGNTGIRRAPYSSTDGGRAVYQVPGSGYDGTPFIFATLAQDFRPSFLNRLICSRCPTPGSRCPGGYAFLLIRTRVRAIRRHRYLGAGNCRAGGERWPECGRNRLKKKKKENGLSCKSTLPPHPPNDPPPTSKDKPEKRKRPTYLPPTTQIHKKAHPPLSPHPLPPLSFPFPPPPPPPFPSFPPSPTPLPPTLSPPPPTPPLFPQPPPPPPLFFPRPPTCPPHFCPSPCFPPPPPPVAPTTPAPFPPSHPYLSSPCAGSPSPYHIHPRPRVYLDGPFRGFDGRLFRAAALRYI